MDGPPPPSSALREGSLPADSSTQEEEQDSSASLAMMMPIVRRRDVLECRLTNWYENFRGLSTSIDEEDDKRAMGGRSNVTIKSELINVPQNFVEYLLSDGVRLPDGATNVSSFIPQETATTGQGDATSNNNDNGDWSDDDDDNDDDEAKDDGRQGGDDSTRNYSFPGLTERVQRAIDNLGGTVFPKWTWSAPKDAVWMNNGSLKCKTPGDVYLLLKSSDFVVHDLLHAFDGVVDDEEEDEDTEHGCSDDPFQHQIIVRQWCNLHPSMEFRCFVWNHTLVAVSQRHHSQHFPHLALEKTLLLGLIQDFHDVFVVNRFAKGRVPHYCFDVYVDKKNKVWLLDFNVWGHQTDALLFAWDELMTLAQPPPSQQQQQDSSSNIVDFRVVEGDREIRHDPLASYRAPIDTLDLVTMNGTDAANFEEFRSMCQKPSERDD